MFNNRFNSTKKDPLVEAVEGAMKDGVLRREAERLVNEHFGVFSRQAVIRENLAAYDAALEEAYKCMKEDEKKEEKGEKKVDKPKSDYSKMREKMVGKGKDLETTRKIVGEKWEGSKEDTDEDKKLAKKHGMTMKQWEKSAADKKHDAKEKEMDEELAKKDYDKDGKIESPKDEVWGSRFRAAKAAGKMEEEQIDELSKKTLGSYINKAASRKPYTSIYGAAYDADSGDPRARKTIQKRQKGIERAIDRLTKEEVEELDETPETRRKGPAGPAPKGTYAHPDTKKKFRELKKKFPLKKPEPIKPFSEAIREAVAKKMKSSVTAPQEFKQGRFANKGAVTKAPVPGASILEYEQIDETPETKTRVDPRPAPKGTYADPDTKKKFRELKKKFPLKKGPINPANEEVELDEAAYSAKAAREGKDIGKPGKMFSKIASKAGKKYGSKERGKAVAGAILKRIRAKHMEEQTQIDELSAFGAEFAAARKAGLSQFRSKVTGQMTSTALKGQSKSPSAAKPASSVSKSTSGMTADVAASRTSGSSLPSMATSGTPSRVPSSAENKAASNVLRDKGPSMTRQYSFPGSTVAPPRADMDSKTPRNPASAADVSGMDKMKAMSNLKSDTPTTPGSMKISAQPAPITGPSGTDKMKTMASLKEEVQVGTAKYRIV